jgi:hypothetical protein
MFLVCASKPSMAASMIGFVSLPVGMSMVPFSPQPSCHSEAQQDL